MTIIRPDLTVEEKARLNYRKGVIPYMPEEVAEFEAQMIRFLRGEWDDPAAFTSYRLMRGVYGQRQADVQMLRIKIPSGSLTADQMEVLGQVVEEYAPLKKGHVTTRENIQVYFIKLEDTPVMMWRLGKVGLTTREAGGNTVRNVVGCPQSGVAPEEPFYVSPYLAAFARWFVRHPYTQDLPRKFKVAFASCAQDCVVTAIHDLAFIPRIQAGADGYERRGFQVLAGGGTSIMPRLAFTLYDFVPVEEYLRISEAIIRIFHRTDELRKNRMRARIKFYIDRVGIDAFRREVEEEMQQSWASRSFDPTPLMTLPSELQDEPPTLVQAPVNGRGNPEFLRWRETNARPQKQAGYYLVWVKLPLGDIQAHQFPVLARIARRYAGGQARTTTEQNLLFRWVPEGHLYRVWEELQAVDLAEAGIHRLTDVVSCPGTDSCKLGITSSMGLGRALREVLQDVAPDDPLVQALRIKISACPNGCARHHIAHIGFHGAATRSDGQQVPAYELFLGGDYGNGALTRFGYRIKTKVPARRVPDMVRDIIHFYQEQRQPGEPFPGFVDRVGTRPFETLARRYNEVGPLNRENLHAYMDWGKTVVFKVERGEGECAM